MLDVPGARRGRGCGGLRRRDFLRVGSLAFGGLSLSDLLRHRAFGGEAARSPRAKSGILLWLPGGPSHFETWDPKPHAPSEIRGPFGAVPTKVTGLTISDLFPRLAGIADKFSVVRSCCHAESGHGGGERWVMTGYASRSPEFELPHDYPKVGSVVAKMRGSNRRGMLPFMAVPPSNLHNNSAAYLGVAYNPLELYSNGRQWEMQLEAVVKPPRLEARRELRQALDRIRRDADASGLMDSMDSLEQQAFEMVSGGAAREAFDPSKEPDAVRERYGAHEWGKSCMLARRLIEAGTTFVTVSVGSWDQHGSAGGTIKDKYTEYAPQVDQAVTTLLTDLDERGLLDETVVYLLGEFGRTPRINKTGGRDHWPQAMSVLMTGGGIRRGIVVGATSPNGEHPIDRTLGPADILATVYHQLGVDYRREFINGEGRPVKLLPGGEPIRELV
jgi:Protein of unknown function (DUF1501)